MRFTRQADGYRAWFALVDNKGALITGAVAGDFTVTVVDQADSASNNPAVSESTQKSGLYTFLVPASFLNTNGLGVYAVLVEVAKSSTPKIDDAFQEALRVTVRDFDNVLSVAIDGAFTAADALKYAASWAAGAFTESTISGTIKDFAFTDRAGAALYTVRITDATGRTRTAG